MFNIGIDFQFLVEPPSKLIGCEPAIQFASLGNTDDARLLADNQNQGIGVLRKAQRRPMPGPEFRRQIASFIKRKLHAGGGKSPVADDNPHVVESRA